MLCIWSVSWKRGDIPALESPTATTSTSEIATVADPSGGWKPHGKCQGFLWRCLWCMTYSCVILFLWSSFAQLVSICICFWINKSTKQASAWCYSLSPPKTQQLLIIARWKLLTSSVRCVPHMGIFVEPTWHPRKFFVGRHTLPLIINHGSRGKKPDVSPKK